jgi:hypothetical protein
VRGGERPQLAPLNLASNSVQGANVQGANLRSSDYQNPLPDSADHVR